MEGVKINSGLEFEKRFAMIAKPQKIQKQVVIQISFSFYLKINKKGGLNKVQGVGNKLEKLMSGVDVY